MTHMSAFRCSLFRLYTIKLAETTSSIIEKITIDENPDLKQALNWLNEKVQEIIDFVENGCCGIELSEVDNVLSDIVSVVKALEFFFKERSENEAVQLCRECLYTLQRMRDIVRLETGLQVTHPYPGTTYLPVRIDHIYPLQYKYLSCEVSDEEKAILRYLQESGGKKTLSELIHELRIDRSVLYRYLRNLVLKGLVVREYDKERGKIVYNIKGGE